MSNPELPEASGDTYLGIEIPDDVAGAIKIERKKRKENFVTLRSEIARVSIFGINNKFEQSFHTRPTESGVVKVSFEATTYPRLGKCYRIIQNEERSDDFDGRSLLIHDYVVADEANIISYQYSDLYKEHHKHKWRDLTDDHGPILGLRGSSLVKMEGKKYELALPTSDAADLEEVLLRRIDVVYLTSVLQSLNEVTCDEIIS